MNKKLFLSLLFMCISICAFCSSNVSAEKYGSLTYVVSDEEITITDCDTSVTSVTIPEKIYGYLVKCIGDNAFSECSRLQTVTIPDNITSIGHYAFSDCSNLTTVNISLSKYQTLDEDGWHTRSNLTSIGSYAFYNCSGLTSITIPDNVTSIGSHAFYNCTGLTSIYWDAKSIDGFASDKHIFDYSGQDGSGMNVVFGWLVEKVPAYTFYSSDSTASPKITSVKIGNSTTDIGNYAFYKCAELSKLIIGKNVTTIGDYAFYYCSELTSLTIPNSVANIGDYAFMYCTGLTSLIFSDSVTNIGKFVFANCSGLTSLNIPNSVTSIGDYAFMYCSKLTNLDIPNSVTSIGACAFSNCAGLTTLTIPNSVLNIGNYAFTGCSELTQINWNAKVSRSFPLRNGIFSYAGHAGSGIDVVFGEDVNFIPGRLFQPDHDSLGSIPNIKSVIIGDNVANIGSHAFYGCAGLSDVLFGNSLKNISDYAFYKCTSLTSLTIPESVTNVGEYTFAYCSGLKSIAIPNSEISIGNYAFYSCDSLSDITMGKSVKSIGYRAFADSDSDKSVATTTNFFGTPEEFLNIDKGVYNYRLFENLIFSHTKTTVSADGKSFAITPINIYSGNTIILALYYNDRVVDVQTSVFDGNEIPFTTTETYTDAKVMVWDNLTNLTPVCSAEIVEL